MVYCWAQDQEPETGIKWCTVKSRDSQGMTLTDKNTEGWNEHEHKGSKGKNDKKKSMDKCLRDLGSIWGGDYLEGLFDKVWDR